jgi:16S rRNA (cytidine1402-2'-O)-methyltransferase
MESTAGKLYLIPTPIGNTGDITQRALEVLGRVDVVACEDTRHTGSLLKKLGIRAKLTSYYEFNERSRAQRLADQIRAGASVAVVTDAGSPGISDPAYRVVRAAVQLGLDIVPLPGANAIIPALTASGLPTDRFFFEGFLSHKSGARRTRLEKLVELEHTLVFYESPHRIVRCLADMLDILGDRPMCLAREISKKFEEFRRGPISAVLESAGRQTPKGEMVVVVAGRGFADASLTEIPDEE